MKVWGAVFNIIALMILAMLMTVYINISRMCDRDIEQMVYQYAVRQATEAMFAQTLTSEDIDMDYGERGYLAINSSQALDVYCRMICYNYDISISPENFDAIKDSIKACALCGFDGFYLAETFESDIIPDNGILKDGWELRFGIKRPYIAKANDNTYMLDTYNEAYTFMKTDPGEVGRVIISNIYGYPTGIGEKVQSIINESVRNALLDEMMYSRNPNKDEIDFRLYFPEMTTNSGVNPIKPPCVVLIADSPDFASEVPVTATSVSGYTVTTPRYVIAIKDKDSGKYYYCYENQLTSMEESVFEVIDYFSDVEKAASSQAPDGSYYAPHFDIMLRKSRTDKV